jgi:hypothetical protein
MEHLGHSSITVTMDRYGDLFPDEKDRLAKGLDVGRGRRPQGSRPARPAGRKPGLDEV